MEVAEHVEHRLEPQVLHGALPVAVQGQAPVLWAEMGVVSGGGRQGCLGSAPCLASASEGQGEGQVSQRPYAASERGPLTWEPHLGRGRVTPVAGMGMRAAGPGRGWRGDALVPI